MAAVRTDAVPTAARGPIGPVGEDHERPELERFFVLLEFFFEHGKPAHHRAVQVGGVVFGLVRAETLEPSFEAALLFRETHDRVNLFGAIESVHSHLLGLPHSLLELERRVDQGEQDDEDMDRRARPARG